MTQQDNIQTEYQRIFLSKLALERKVAVPNIKGLNYEQTSAEIARIQALPMKDWAAAKRHKAERLAEQAQQETKPVEQAVPQVSPSDGDKAKRGMCFKLVWQSWVANKLDIKSDRAGFKADVEEAYKLALECEGQ